MACPQKENGNTPIANEIMEALARTYLSSYETQVIFAILRKTYGWHKKEDWISLSQLSEMTKILPQHISRTIKKLAIRSIIIRNKKKIGFNKDYDKWDNIPKQVIPIQVIGVTQTGIKYIPKQVTTKETKETIQKKDGIPYFLTSSFKWNQEKRKHIKAGGRVVDGCILTEKNGVMLLMKKDEAGKKVWQDYKQYKLTHKKYGIQRNQR
jgi:phage replication O-like protein O